MQVLVFQDTQFDIVDRNGQPWLRSPQIAGALGYNRADRIADVYNRNADEFTSSMTALVELGTAGGKQQVRIFSLRGAHLLGMLSRTKKAKEFRAWVLDVLEGLAEAPVHARAKRQPKALSSGLTIEQQDAIKGMVKARVETLPKNKQAKGAITLWSSLKSKFGCTYKQIDPAQYPDAISLVARVDLDGEWLPHEEAKVERLNIHHPIDSLLIGRRRDMIQPVNANTQLLSVTLNDLREFHSSPCEQVLHVLAEAGYEVEGAWWELRTYRNKLAYLMPLIENLHAVATEPQQYVVNAGRPRMPTE